MHESVFLFTPRTPKITYVSNWLWVPKEQLSTDWLSDNLEFIPRTTDEFDADVIKLWYETDNHWVIPRHSIPLNPPYVDLRPVRFTPTFFEDHIELFETQKEAFDKLVIHKEGILNLAPGKGKTVLALKRVAHDQVPTLVVVPDVGLIAQWENRIREFLAYKGPIGRIQGQVQNWQHPIVIASIKSLAMYYREIPIKVRKYYGLIIFDECHRTAASTFKLALPMFWGNRIGLTATVERFDGLEGILQAHVGDVFFQDKDYEWQPKIVFVQQYGQVPMHPRTGQMQRISLMINALLKHKQRNELIERLVIRLLNQDRRILVLTSRLKHVDYLAKKLNGTKLTGHTTQQLRSWILENNRLVVATQKVASEGLDAVSLDTVIFASPFSFYGLFQQGAGRAMRKVPGLNKKQPLIVYIWDVNNSILKNMGAKLMRSLRNDGKKFFILSPDQV